VIPENTTQPVFIFLPVRGPDGEEAPDVVDPVCGRALAKSDVAGRLVYDGRDHYFCSLKCAERFAASAREPEMR
jgi:YHS domain-containing protein